MFIVTLKLSDNKAQASRFMDKHNKWIKDGFDDGIFLLVGSIKPNLGGAVLAHNITVGELEKRVTNDPFVKENIVTPEIIEVSPAMADERLNFLLS